MVKNFRIPLNGHYYFLFSNVRVFKKPDLSNNGHEKKLKHEVRAFSLMPKYYSQLYFMPFSLCKLPKTIKHYFSVF